MAKNKVEINGIKYTIQNNQADNENSISWKYDPIEEEKCETCSGCGFH